MNAVLKIFLSMSFSGGLLILALLFGKRFLKDKISRQWQYYIWLIVILRLLLPFGPETNLLGKTYQAVDQAITQAAPQQYQPSLNTSESSFAHVDGFEQNNEKTDNPMESAYSPAEDLKTVHPLQDIGSLLTDHVWLIWLVAALVLLIRKITIYQSFMRYIKAGSAPVSDVEMLDRLSVAAEREGIKKPIELYVNPLTSSPLLIGFFHPCIVLPSADISEKDFHYIILHELTHYKRRDMFYKWLVQITVCLHWFNPLAHLMSREITKACEFSCDEAVLAKMGSDNAQEYGKTLLDAMAAVGKYKENLGAVTLNENKRLLKERLSAIMKFKKQSKAVIFLTVTLTLCIVLSAAFVGVYSVAAAAAIQPSAPQSDDLPIPDADQPSPSQSDNPPVMETLELKGTTYYLVSSEAQLRAIGTGEYGMDGNYMQQADIQLSADEWMPIGTWDAPFTGTFNGNGFEIIGLTMTDPYAELIGLFGFVENAHIYNVTMRDFDITSAGRKSKRISVGAILAVNKGSRSYDNFVYPKETGDDINGQTAGEPLSEIDQELESWLDRALEDGKWDFQSVLYDKLRQYDEFDELEKKHQAACEELGEKLKKELETFGGRVWHPLVYPVDQESIADGEIVWLGEYTLSEGDRIWYYVYAETGIGLQVGFARPDDELLNTTYYSVQSSDQEGEKCECIASFTFRQPVEPGTYRLFLKATDGALENVKGSISIGYAADVS